MADDNGRGDTYEKLASSARITVLAALLFAFLVVSAYVMHFSQGQFSGAPENWGQFGDFIGGVINPAVGLATVYLVFVSITLQRKELQASVAELKASNESAARQNFEQSLFAWLRTYQALLSDIRVGDRVGRDALEHWFKSHFAMTAMLDKLPGATSLGSGTDRLFRMCHDVERGHDPSELHAFFDHVYSAYTQLYRNKRSDLDALYRTLYRMTLWIDNSEFDLRTRWHYVALVRAQLSWIEGVFLLFNGLTAEGKKFGPIANKYALFDNLTVGANSIVHMVVHTLRLSQPLGHNGQDGAMLWPYSAAAFDSDVAREQAPSEIPPLVLRPD